MKKSLVSIFSVCLFLFGMISVFGDDHKHELHEIGERIKQAVKLGKITEKEGWAKWYAVLREHGHDDEHDEHEWEEDEEERGEVEELEREIEIRKFEFELERMEREFDRERREWEYEMERMERDFDRERREWDMENLEWDMRRNQMEMEMRGGPKREMFSPVGRVERHDHARDSKDYLDSNCKSDCGKQNKQSECKKGKAVQNKKGCCQSGGCEKSDSCSKKDTACCNKDTKSCPSKKGKKPRGFSKDQSGKKKKRK